MMTLEFAILMFGTVSDRWLWAVLGQLWRSIRWTPAACCLLSLAVSVLGLWGWVCSMVWSFSDAAVWGRLCRGKMLYFIVCSKRDSLCPVKFLICD